MAFSSFIIERAVRDHPEIHYYLEVITESRERAKTCARVLGKWGVVGTPVVTPEETD